MKPTSLIAMAAATFVAVASNAALAEEPSVVQFANMHDPADAETTFEGAGILRRHADGVAISLHMTGLQRKGAYTVWWAIFNNPDDCTLPCGPDDVGAGVGQVFHATGFVTGTDGVANVSAGLALGSLPEGVDRLSANNPAIDPAFETGLLDPFGAEIHAIARNHGKPINGRVAEQIGSLAGGCDVFACVDEQAVAFLPVQAE